MLRHLLGFSPLCGSCIEALASPGNLLEMKILASGQGGCVGKYGIYILPQPYQITAKLKSNHHSELPEI